ncbi:MAG: hypothetical protein ACPH9L_03055, partial [Flavobacteriaceae bacterium]
MKTQSFFIKYISLLFVLGTCFSCIKDTDFEQYDTLIIYPIVEANLVNAQEPAASFVDSSGAELPSISDQVIFDVFNSDFSVDNLIKAELVFGITNSINKAFQIKMDFYDSADALQHTFSIDIDNSPTNTPLFTEHIEVFENMNWGDDMFDDRLALKHYLGGYFIIDFLSIFPFQLLLSSPGRLTR